MTFFWSHFWKISTFFLLWNVKWKMIKKIRFQSIVWGDFKTITITNNFKLLKVRILLVLSLLLIIIDLYLADSANLWPFTLWFLLLFLDWSRSKTCYSRNQLSARNKYNWRSWNMKAKFWSVWIMRKKDEIWFSAILSVIRS